MVPCKVAVSEATVENIPRDENQKTESRFLPAALGRSPAGASHDDVLAVDVQDASACKEAVPGT